MATITAPKPNKFAGTCVDCRKGLAVGEGVLLGKSHSKGPWEIAHSIDRACVRIATVSVEDRRQAEYERILSEAGGNIDVAVRILGDLNEWYDGEPRIQFGCEIAMREALGFDASEARRALEDAIECEERYVRTGVWS